MRRFRWFIAAATLVYVGLAVVLAVFSQCQDGQRQNYYYRIEISRICEAVSSDPQISEKAASSGQQICEIDPKEYSRVQEVEKVSFLSAAQEIPALLTKFYQCRNHYEMQVVPVIQNQKLIGYLRFDYKIHSNSSHILVLAEMVLTAVYVLVLAGMIAVYHSILKPFGEFMGLPYELASGHYDLTMKESRHRYFGKFLWGMGMLKDTLNQQRQKELELNREKKMLLLAVSHDIKTPLNAIRLYAKGMEEGVYTDPEEQRRAAVMIQDKVLEIDHFVVAIVKSSKEDILSIQVNAGEEYYLKDLMDHIRSGYEEKCALRHLMFEIAPVENQLMKGDMERMYQAIGNLIENAIKYGDGQKIQITFSEEEDCQLIHVFNTGRPVEETEIMHLYESFYRGSNAEGRAGNGLGLYICSEIIHKMNGEIYAECHPDGMEFVLVCQKA